MGAILLHSHKLLWSCMTISSREVWRWLRRFGGSRRVVVSHSQCQLLLSSSKDLVGCEQPQDDTFVRCCAGKDCPSTRGGPQTWHGRSQGEANGGSPGDNILQRSFRRLPIFQTTRLLDRGLKGGR